MSMYDYDYEYVPEVKKQLKFYNHRNHCVFWEKELRSGLPRLRPGAPFYQLWIRYFRKLFLANRNHMLGYFYIKSINQLLTLRKNHIYSKYWYFIHPLSSFASYKNMVMVFLYVMFLIWEPLILCKFIDIDICTWSWVALKLAVDIVIKMFTGIIDEKSGVVVFSIKTVFKDYAKHFLITDLLCSLFLLTYCQVQSSFKTSISPISDCSIRIVQIYLRLARMLYVLKFISDYMSFFRFTKIFIYCIWALSASLILIHNLTCVSYLLVTEVYNNTEWHVTSFYIKDEKADKFYKYIENLTLVYGFFFNFRPAYTKYENSLISTIVVVHGYALLIAVSVILSIEMYSIKENGNQHDFFLQQIKEYVNLKKLPEETKERVIAYYTYRFRHKYFREKAVLDTLSVHLKQEILLATCMPLIERNKFFRILPKACVGAIIAHFKREIYLWNDVIFRAGDKDDHIYLIQTGAVAIYKDDGTELYHMIDESFFGIDSLEDSGQQWVRKFSTVTLEITEVYTMHHSDLVLCLKPFPEFYESVAANVKERNEAIDNLMQNPEEAYMEDMWNVMNFNKFSCHFS